MSIQFGPEWADFENRLARYPQVTEANLTRALTASLLMIEADAKRNVAQDTRRLAGSINHQIVGTYPNLVGRVGPSVTYGRFVEFGRRSGGMPPVDALMGWVRRHWRPAFIGPIQRGSLRPKRTPPRNVTEAQIRSRAWALARHIALHGVRAQPFLQPAYRRNQRQIEQLFLRMGARIVAYLAGGPAV